MMWIGLLLAGVNGFLAVAFGAFGAHAIADPQVKDWLHTGAQYQMVHAVAGLACYALAIRIGGAMRWAGLLFGLGGLAFGGSLYLLALTGVRLFGAVTPLGGALMLAGWAAVIWSGLFEWRRSRG